MRHPISRLLAWTRARFGPQPQAVHLGLSAPPPAPPIPIAYATPTTTVVFTPHGINIRPRGPHPRCTCLGAVHDLAAANSPNGATA